MISVIIPIYQHARVLERCLAALEQQTYSNFDVVLVDDGSVPPVTLSQTKYAFPVRVVRQQHRGAPAARNRGAEESGGEYLLFCDADVVLQRVALERMLAMLEQHPDASYAYSAFRFGWKVFPSFPFDAARLQTMPYIHTTALLRREHFPSFDESLERFQDWDLWWTMLEAGHVGVHSPEVLFAVVDTRGTMSRWLPSLLYRFPYRTKRVQAYDLAAEIIREKHRQQSKR